MKLIIEIEDFQNRGKFMAFKRLDFSSIAEDNQVVCYTFNKNKAKIEQFLRLADHIEQVVKEWDYTNGDSLPSNDSTTGQ